MDLKIDLTSRDLVFTNGDLSIVSGLEAIQQRLQIKLLFFFNEWFLDKSLGLDWFGTVYIKNPDQSLIDNMILVAVTDDPSVISILEYSSTYNILHRSFTIVLKIQAIEGIVNINEVLII